MTYAGNANPSNSSRIVSRNNDVGFPLLSVIENKCENAEAHRVTAAKANKYTIISFRVIHMNHLIVISKSTDV